MGTHQNPTDWSSPPEPEVRKAKTEMEEELLIKLGVKKEQIEFHPLIKISRCDRTKSSLFLDYSRVKPPLKELPVPARNAWNCVDPAARQMSDLARKGPRITSLDTPAKHHERQPRIPSGDPDYHKKRAARFRKLADILSEWRVIHQLAYEPIPDLIDIDNFDLLRPVSSETSESSKTRTTISRSRSKASSRGAASPTLKSITRRARTMADKWRSIKREMMANMKAARLKADKDTARSEVRLYIASTPDMAEEREFLAEVAYPELNRFCERIGVNCHVVDMRIGSRMSNDLVTLQLCQQEIKKCRDLSVGPHFVCLIGNEVGKQLPGLMTREDLEGVREILLKDKLKGVELLDEYYRLDSNQIPPMYLLAKDDLNKRVDAEDCINTLTESLERAMEKLRNNGTMGVQSENFFKWTTIAKEIECGLLACKLPQTQILCMLKDNKGTDSTGGSLQLHDVIKTYFSSYHCEGNVIHLAKGRQATLSYMRNMCTMFLNKAMELLDNNIDMLKFDPSEHLTETSDLVQHVHLVNLACQQRIAFGNHEQLMQIRDAMANPSYKKPIVISGEEGSGKTMFAAHLSESVLKWHGKTTVVVRLLGQSLRTSSLYHTLISLCKQIAFLYTVNLRISPQITLLELIKLFRQLIKEASDQRSGPLVIILDALERLPDLEPHYMSPLIDDFPLNVLFIVTVRFGHPYMKLLKACPQTVLYLAIEGISGPQRKQMIERIIREKSRKMTDDQAVGVINKLSYEENPLILTVCAAIIIHWPSSILPEIKGFDTLSNCFDQLLVTLEDNVEHTITKYALCFLHSSRYGLAHPELLHLIISHPEVLNEIQNEFSEMSVLEGYPYQCQLSRVLSCIEPFVIASKVDGESLVRIAHQSFSDAIAKRYMKGDFATDIHTHMATFFQFIRRGLLLTVQEISENKNAALSGQNWRTMRSVPYHLCHSSSNLDESLKVLKDHVLLNFSWIINEIYAGFLSDFLSDCKYVLKTLKMDTDILSIQRLLLNLRLIIEENPSSLSTIISQFPEHSSPYFIEFINQAKQWLKQVHFPILIPYATTMFFSGWFCNGPFTRNSSHILSSKDWMYVVSFRDAKFDIMDVQTGECSETVDAVLHKPQIWGTYKLTGIMDNSLKTWDILGGKLLRKVPLGPHRVMWLDIQDDGTVYYAADRMIKTLNAITEMPKVLIEAEEKIRDASISSKRVPHIVTIHTQSQLTVNIWKVVNMKSQLLDPVVLENKELSQYCKPVTVTSDGKYTVIVFESEAIIIANLDQDVEFDVKFGQETITICILTRSNDHVLFATNAGQIKGYLLNSGPEVFTAVTEETKYQGKKARIVSMVTTEDDHFLLVGLASGIVVMFNIPTGLRVHAVIASKHRITQLLYMTDDNHFQHLMVLDMDGTAQVYNFQPILRCARECLFQIMLDEDLIKEEQAKLEISSYHAFYVENGHTKMFQNGPDLTAFYNKEKKDVFESKKELQSSAKNVATSWEHSGKIHDCTNISHAVMANGLGDLLITFTEDKKIAWWNIISDSLLAAKPVALTSHLESITPVFYDQAVLLMSRDNKDGESIQVMYSPQRSMAPLIKDKVLACMISGDRKRLGLLTSTRQAFTLTVVDLSNHEETVTPLHLGNMAGAVAVNRAKFAFTKELDMVLAYMKADERRTMFLCWNLRPFTRESTVSDAIDEQTDEQTDDTTHADEIHAESVKDFDLRVTNVFFINTKDVVVGTATGDIYIIETFSLNITEVFTKDAIIASKVNPWSKIPNHTKPHRSAVKYMYLTPDQGHLLSVDTFRICVWNLKSLLLLFATPSSEKLVNADVSHDGKLLVGGMTNGVIRLWSVYHRQLLCTFRIPATLGHVFLTSDNNRVIALVSDHERKHVVVFEARNTYEYFIDRPDEKLFNPPGKKNS